LGVSHNLAVGGINTGEVLVLALARDEGSVLSSVGCVVGAADTVVDVLAELGSIRTGGVANLETELTATHEIVPFDDLLEGVVVAVVAGEAVRVDQASKRVTTQVGTMGIQFTTRVTVFDVNESLLDEADDLHIIGRPHELDTGEGALGYEPGTATRLGAPGNFLAFSIGDEGVGFARRPEAEVVEAIQERRLAE